MTNLNVWSRSRLFLPGAGADPIQSGSESALGPQTSGARAAPKSGGSAALPLSLFCIFFLYVLAVFVFFSFFFLFVLVFPYFCSVVSIFLTIISSRLCFLRNIFFYFLIPFCVFFSCPFFNALSEPALVFSVSYYFYLSCYVSEHFSFSSLFNCEWIIY